MKSDRLTIKTADAYRIAGVYAFGGFLWILFSDQVLLYFFHDAALLARIQTAKGWIFILVTAILLLFLVKRSIEKIHLEQQHLANIIKATKTGIWEWNVKTDQLLTNDRWYQMTGYPRAEIAPLTSKKLEQLLHPEDMQRVKKILRELINNQRDDYECEFRLQHKQGGWVWIQDRGKVIQRDQNCSPLVITGTYHDITSKKKAGQDLRLAQYCLDHSAVAIFSLDQNGQIVMANNRACQNLLYTKDEMHTLSIFDIDPNFTPHIWQQHRNKLRRHKHVNFESTNKRKDGTIFPVEVTVNLLNFEAKEVAFSFVQDISQRKQLQNELQQKNKMEAIGLMAGGMAHNFNNSLAIVLGNLEMAIRKGDNSNRLTGYLNNARVAALRSRDLISQIMTYSRKSPGRDTLFNLRELLVETFTLLKSTTPATINHKLSLPEQYEDLIIKGNPSRIQEIILNLHGNAVHAVNEVGEITISLKKEVGTLECTASHHQAGHYARIDFADSGCGIPEEILLKIFDPFFTTKNINEGTGMGLATVKGIVEAHNGFINVTSSPGKGTVFNLFFPLAQEQDTNSADSENTDIFTGTECILLVDDDDKLIKINQDMLTELGYHVFTAAHAEEALDILLCSKETFKLVITDMTMPGKTGRQLAQEINSNFPDLPIILCTGYSSKVSEQDLAQQLFAAQCFKPLQLSEISRVIREVLDHQSRPDNRASGGY